MKAGGFRVSDYRPVCSRLGDVEALFRHMETPDAVWVGCFRQRDIAAAVRWARKRDVPVVFDPLISQYDKAVNEFRRFPETSRQAKRLLRRERRLFGKADVIVADTVRHAAYYSEVLEVPREKIKIVYVGADMHFHPPEKARQPGDVLEILFYGSFLPLQGPDVIVEAARLTVGHPVRWTLVGDGPERGRCMAAAKGLDNIVFRDPVPYGILPSVIADYDVLLGVFGITEKSSRVMPNKFFQAIASGKPVITMRSDAYPQAVSGSGAVRFVPSGDAGSLADAVLEWNSDRAALSRAASEARILYEREFGASVIGSQIEEVFGSLCASSREGLKMI